MAVDADAAELTLDTSGCEPACEDEDVEDIETSRGGNTETEQSQPGNTKGDSRTATGKMLAACVAIIAALAGLTGWLGYQHYQLHRAQQLHDLFLQAARQGAINLTTISYTEAGAAVARILDSSTGQFRDDFQRRSQPFIELVTKMQSTSVGTIIDAGVQSEQDNEAQVLVAVNVNTSLAGTPEPQPRAWRMRITVQKAGNSAKVSNVEFVP
jgi:Mce-associated membrane protein